MRVVPSVVAVVALATVAAAALVVHHDSPVTNAGQAVGYVPETATRSLAVIGDSYSSGTSMGGVGDNGWPVMVAGLNQLQLSNHAVAGSGYITNANGSSNAFPVQAMSVARQHPSYVIVWGARDDLNDGSRRSDPPSRLEAIAAGMTVTLKNLKRGVPADKILVIGPTWINNRAPEAYTQLTAMEAEIAQSEGVDFVPTIGQRAWFAGNNAAYIGQDGEHPTDAGEQHIAYLIQNALISSRILAKTAPTESDGVPPIVPTVTATVTPPPKTVTATTTAPATATPTVTVTTTPTATVTVLGPP